MSDYLPKTDDGLLQWMTTFLDAVQSHAELPGLSADQRSLLIAQGQRYRTALSEY